MIGEEDDAGDARQSEGVEGVVQDDGPGAAEVALDAIDVEGAVAADVGGPEVVALDGDPAIFPPAVAWGALTRKPSEPYTSLLKAT